LVFHHKLAQAEIVNVDDWWLQTDNLGGLRQSTTAEGQAVFNSNSNTGERVYYNQGGWAGYTWEGKRRALFRFSDSASTEAYKHAAYRDQYRISTSTNATNDLFAGMVMIKEQNSTSSSTLADVPAPMGITALAFAGLMLMRRRKI
jgi:hypothetical protein